jgi:predicted DNA-binding transcriptional regulator AlpA
VPVERTDSTEPVRMMAKEEVLALLPRGKSYVTLWTLIRKGLFPPARVIGGSIGWLSDEVYNAIRNLPRRIPRGLAVIAAIVIAATIFFTSNL